MDMGRLDTYVVRTEYVICTISTYMLGMYGISQDGVGFALSGYEYVRSMHAPSRRVLVLDHLRFVSPFFALLRILCRAVSPRPTEYTFGVIVILPAVLRKVLEYLF